MKIKKHLLSVALAVGLTGSATAMATSHEIEMAPSGQIGFILAYKASGGSSKPLARLGEAASTGAGGAAGGLAMVYIGAKIGGSLGAFVGGPVGVIAGAATGAA